MNDIERNQAAVRTRMNMLATMLRNYGVAIVIGALLLPALRNDRIPIWEICAALVVGFILCGLAIYIAPFGKEEEEPP